MQAAELFSQKHFAEVVQQEEFMLLSQSEVEKLIKCDEIQVRLSALFHSEWVPAFKCTWETRTFDLLRQCHTFKSET